jgi:hypothetical protein
MLTNLNAPLTGVIGQGKKARSRDRWWCVRSPYGRRGYLPCDVKGEWALVARHVRPSVRGRCP